MTCNRPTGSVSRVMPIKKPDRHIDREAYANSKRCCQ